MQALFESIGALFHTIGTISDLLTWLVCGLLDMGEMLMESVSVFSTVIKFFPQAVVTSLTAVCGGLVVLRIFGRS